MPSAPLSDPFGVGLFPRQLTIEVLSDDIFLNIFRHYLGAIPRFWPTLVGVCQRWRQIVLMSPLGLNLRLYFTYRTPVLDVLGHWSELPVIIQYGGGPNLDPPAPNDDDNILAALKQSGRVSSISLTVTSSLSEKLSAISEPFTELEHIVLYSQDNLQLTLPSTFRWGTRLRTLHSTRIAFPSFPHLLLPSQDLVDVQLHEIPITGYFSPEAFANALSGTAQVRSLLLHFHSLPPRRDYLGSPSPSGERVVLPALACLNYRGTSTYLDSFVARIDAPLLGEIDITFFFQPTMDASQLGRFIDRRLEMQTPPVQADLQADVETSAHAISISFTDSSASASLRLQISCRQLDWQLSCMAQVCDQFSLFLSRVEELRINTTQSSSGQDDVVGEQWVDLVRSLSGARDLWIAENLTTDFLRALDQASDGGAIVFSTLRLLSVENPTEMNEPSWDALLSFIKSRALSGHPVKVNVPSQCHVCHECFRQQTELEHHFANKYAFQIVCSYCKEPVSSKPGNDHQFWSHLVIKHSRVARKDVLLSNPSLTYPTTLELEDLRRRHSSWLAPDVVASLTTTTEPHSK